MKQMLILMLLLSANTLKADLVLANKGKSDYRIVLATNAIPSERYAAEELQRYVQRLSGASLPIVTEAERDGSREIWVGESGRLRNLKEPIDFAKLGTDGYTLRTERNRLLIAGGKPRGTLNGVYALLEEQFGIRWFTPELEVVPPTKRLALRSLNQTYVPPLEYREVYWTEIMRNGDFAARHRMNGPNCRLTQKHGGPRVVYFPFVHSLDNLIPRDLYQEHPEYFPLINGKRVNGYVQRCLSNPDVIKLGIANVRKWIKEHPEATIISVSQNDTGNWCHCEQCQALDEREGSPAASLLQFVNTIAADIEPDYPNIRLDTLAYQYTRKPPKTLRPRPNVIIRLCSIECCFAHPLDTCASDGNRRFREDLAAWQPVAPLLYVWDYTPNFAHYEQPFPNFDVLQPNVRFFVQHGVKGLFEEGNYSPGGGGEMAPLRTYLLAKVLWNPDTDVHKHLVEFVRAYYGHAAPQILAYLELLQSQVRNGETHAHIFDSPKAPYLNAAFLSDASTLLEQGVQAAENDNVRFRVQVAQLPVWYVQLATDQVTGESRSTLLRNFLQIARQAGITHISEWQSLDAWAKKMEGK